MYFFKGIKIMNSENCIDKLSFHVEGLLRVLYVDIKYLLFISLQNIRYRNLKLLKSRFVHIII